jgi:hypothetical protein
MFKELMKAAVGVVTVPVDIVADIATVGGILTGKDETYTGKKAGQIMDNLENAIDSTKD